MNAIMVDNWSAQEIALDTYNLKEEISDNYGKLLSAILLWDEIYYPLNEKAVMWGKMQNGKINSVLKPIDDNLHMFETEASGIYAEFYHDVESSIIAKEGIRYLLLSNYKGLDYFPSSKRSAFFQKYNPSNIAHKLNRLDFIGTLDEEINDYFAEYNAKFGKKAFEIQRPILSDFIIQNTPHDMSYIEFAMQLRNEKSILQYRKYLADLEIALENREWIRLTELFNLSHEAVSNVTKLDKKSMGTIGVSVSPLPSLSYSKEIEISKRKVHLTFLDKLSSFAFDGRKID